MKIKLDIKEIEKSIRKGNGLMPSIAFKDRKKFSRKEKHKVNFSVDLSSSKKKPLFQF